MKIQEFLSEGKISKEGFLKLEKLIEENEKLKESFGYEITDYGNYKITKYFKEKSDFLNEFEKDLKSRNIHLEKTNDMLEVKNRAFLKENERLNLIITNISRNFEAFNPIRAVVRCKKLIKKTIPND